MSLHGEGERSPLKHARCCLAPCSDERLLRGRGKNKEMNEDPPKPVAIYVVRALCATTDIICMDKFCNNGNFHDGDQATINAL
jgi:hypothetical protein